MQDGAMGVIRFASQAARDLILEIEQGVVNVLYALSLYVKFVSGCFLQSL